jgi:hypothetical protein
MSTLNPLDFKSPEDYTREDLIDLCERGVVPCSEWNDRDSLSAQHNLEEVYSYLKAGCDYVITTESDRTVWVAFKNVTLEQYRDANYSLNIDSKDDYLNYCESESIEPGEMFECYGRYISDSMFKDYFNPYDDLDPLNNKKILEGYLGGYIPTEFRLAEADGSDWY